VVAVVQLVDGVEAADADLREEAARHIARYKLPKLILYVDEIVRSPSGKADYRWARQLAAEPVA
jgi:fatty-acyl-CoA synthase